MQQGAQYSGMGKDLYDSYPQAKEIFDLAGDQIKEWCFEGDAETLKQTHVTQPTIYTVSMAAYKTLLAELEKNGLSDKLEIDAVAGFSLGEYSALTAAGVIPKISEGVEIVAQRGTLMQEAGRDEDGNAKGTMAAALGKREKILDLVEQGKRRRYPGRRKLQLSEADCRSRRQGSCSTLCRTGERKQDQSDPPQRQHGISQPYDDPGCRKAEGCIASGRTENAGNHRICRCDC